MATLPVIDPAPNSPLIFLSHAGADSDAARALAALLRGAGMEVWLDLERLQPGDMWQHEIHSALTRAQALILYVGRFELAHWVDFEVQVALDRNAKERTFRIIPVLGPGSDVSALPEFVRLFQCVNMREGQLPPEELKALVAGILRTDTKRVPVLPPERSPFAGLHAFDVDDALLFFGREKETEELLSCLRRESLLLVIGDSGCGKSSLVRAGLIPALLRGRFHDGSSWLASWRIAIARPGNDPFRELAETLPDLDLDRRFRAEQIASNRKLLAEGVEGVRDIIAGSVPAGARTLLVIDQFEEIFTSTPNPDTRRRYIDCLLRAANTVGTRPVHVALTLRADFYSRCWEHPDLPSRAAKNQYPVRHMGQDTLRQLIERPLSLAGAAAEPGLIETILLEVGGKPGSLPLLEHALDQLWQNRRVNGGVWITHESYEKLGRLSGALRVHANEAMARLPDDEARAIARRFFIELIQLGEGTEDTRRRVAVNDLLAASGNREKAELVLAQLASERLITTGTEYAEVAHEAIIRAWPELGKWVDTERSSVRLERRLLEDAREWERLHRDPEALLAGARLAEASAWFASARRETAPVTSQFIRESLKARRNRRIKMAGIAIGVSTIFAVLLGWTFFHSRWLDLINTANSFLDTNPPCAVAVALKADLWWANTDTQQALEEAVQAASAPLLENGSPGAVFDVAFSPNGEILATGEDQVIHFWDAAVDQRKTPRGLLASAKMDGAAQAIAFSRDGALFAAGASSGMAVVVTVPNGSVRFPVPATQPSDAITAISFGSDGNTMAVGDSSGRVSLWKLDATAPFLSFKQLGGAISALTFSPDGQRLTAAAQDGTIAIWLLATSGLTLLKSPEAFVDYVAFRPDGIELLSASRLGGIHLWRTQGGPEIPLKQSARGVTAAALSFDGVVLATSHVDHTLVIRNAVTLAPRLTIARQADAVTRLALNRQGNRLAEANQLGQVRVYELDPSRLHTLALQTIGQAKVSQLDACRASVPSGSVKAAF
jgi:hypothetical protein